MPNGQQDTDDFVREQLRLRMSRDAGSAPKQGPMARPNGLFCAGMLVRSVDEGKREADWIASTEDVDSYGTIIKQDWDGPHEGLKRFRANPVILFAHDRDELPIGQAVRVEVEKSGTADALLAVRVRFASEKANPMAEMCWQSVLEKTLRGMSVGWIPHGYEQREIKGKPTTVFIQNELYEASVCPVPSNPAALQRMLARTFVDRGARVFSFGGQSPAVATTAKERQMKVIVVDNAALEAAVKLGVADVRDGDDTIRVSLPGLTELRVNATLAKEKADALEKRNADLTAALDAANKRVAEANEGEKRAAEKTAQALKERDAAVAERASLTLAPLTGMDAWQMSPAVRDTVAPLAASNPEAFKRFVDDYHARGVKAGAIKVEAERGHLPTTAADPTPRHTQPGSGNNGGPQVQTRAATGKDPMASILDDVDAEMAKERVLASAAIHADAN